MASYKPDVKYIASIYPGELPPITRALGVSPNATGKGASRSTTFTLKPVKRGQKPFVLEVYDSFEEVLDVVGSSGAKPGEKPRISKPVPVEVIVEDLLNHWTGGLFNVPPGAKPGIMEVINSAPSQKELFQMDAQQTLYFEYLFTEGERLHKENNWKDITETMRLAAEYLGYSRVWSNRSIARETDPCPFCTTMIPRAALVCPTCQHVVKRIPKNLADLQTAEPVQQLT